MPTRPAEPVQPDTRSLWPICWILLAAGLGATTGRLLSVQSPTGETPMLSANDRSRWCTIRALVEDGTYAIDRVIRERHPRTRRPVWQTIDRVRHFGPDGKEHDYSSKPPLLPTLIAPLYWLIRSTTGSTLSNDPFYVMRLILFLVHVLPLALAWWLVGRMSVRHAATGWALLYVTACAVWGSFWTAFAITLNNHVPAAVCVMLGLWGAERCGARPSVAGYAWTGLVCALAAAFELPALAFTVLVLGWLAWNHWRLALAAALPACLVVAAAFFATNYVAHRSWRPPYAHRSDGPVVATLPAESAQDLDRQHWPAGTPLPEGLAAQHVQIQVRTPSQRWVLVLPDQARKYALQRTPEGTIEVRQWDNWYDYPGSYWAGPRKGIDRGERSRALYLLHILIGHHGLFSLTPVWALSVWGAWRWWRQGPAFRRFVAAAFVLSTLACLVFFVSRDQIDRNYGGMTCGFRWMFWILPLQLLCLVPAADRLAARRWGYALAVAALAVSALSVAYGSSNPWRHPWIYDYALYLGWIS